MALARRRCQRRSSIAFKLIESPASMIGPMTLIQVSRSGALFRMSAPLAVRPWIPTTPWSSMISINPSFTKSLIQLTSLGSVKASLVVPPAASTCVGVLAINMNCQVISAGDGTLTLSSSSSWAQRRYPASLSFPATPYFCKYVPGLRRLYLASPFSRASILCNILPIHPVISV